MKKALANASKDIFKPLEIAKFVTILVNSANKDRSLTVCNVWTLIQFLQNKENASAKKTMKNNNKFVFAKKKNMKVAVI